MNTAQKAAAKAASDERETTHKLTEAGHANATRVATSNELSRARARLKEAEAAHPALRSRRSIRRRRRIVALADRQALAS